MFPNRLVRWIREMTLPRVGPTGRIEYRTREGESLNVECREIRAEYPGLRESRALSVISPVVREKTSPLRLSHFQRVKRAALARGRVGKIRP